jgi:hypothetical protein
MQPQDTASCHRCHDRGHGAALLSSLGEQAALVGMDGFHYATCEVQRLERGHREAPNTVDVDGYVALVTRSRTPSEGPVHGPVFDRAGRARRPTTCSWRTTAGPRCAAVSTRSGTSTSRLRSASNAASVACGPSVLRSFGHERRAAEDRVRTVDGRNGHTVEGSRSRADLIVHLDVPESAPHGTAAGVADRRRRPPARTTPRPSEGTGRRGWPASALGAVDLVLAVGEVVLGDDREPGLDLRLGLFALQ